MVRIGFLSCRESAAVPSTNSNARLPPVRTLTRYFAVRYLNFFFAILIVSTLTITLVETFVNFDDGLDPNEGIISLARYLLIRIPSYYFADLIPISAFSAAFFSLAIATQRFEWVAIQAAGLSVRQIVLPLIIAAAGLTALTALLGETLLTRAAAGEASLVERSTDQLTFRGGVFWHHGGDSLYKMADADAAERTLRSVEIFHRTPKGRLKSLIYAPLVRVDPNGNWHLKGASIREFDPEHPEEPARIRLNVDFELPPLSEDSGWLDETRPDALTLSELREYISESSRGEGVRAAAIRLRLTALLHERLTEPVLVMVLTILAIPFALRVKPGGNLASPAILAFGFLASFFFLRSLFQGLIGEGLLPPAVTFWSVPVAFGLGSLIALTRSSRPR